MKLFTDSFVHHYKFFFEKSNLKLRTVIKKLFVFVLKSIAIRSFLYKFLFVRLIFHLNILVCNQLALCCRGMPPALTGNFLRFEPMRTTSSKLILNIKSILNQSSTPNYETNIINFKLKSRNNRIFFIFNEFFSFDAA